jgi:hypothetical protein
MNTNLLELEDLLSLQESYYENLIELGLFFENKGQQNNAAEIYKKELKKAEKAKTDLSNNMLGLLE